MLHVGIGLIAQRHNLVSWAIDQRLRRLVSAADTKVLEHGGITVIAQATRVSRRAVRVGLKELASHELEAS